MKVWLNTLPSFFLFSGIVCFFLSNSCKSPSLNNPCDPSSKAYFYTWLAKAMIGDKSAHCGISFAAPPTILNLRNKGIVETGFMIGTANETIAAVEVSIDSGSFSDATGTSNWKFQFPTGTSTWKNNSLHTIAVRSKGTSGNVSSVATITVRKGENKDVNGDGYADAIVGAVGYSSFRGRVYIFHSAGATGITSTGAESATTKLDGETLPTATSQFGSSVALGDVNGDGYADAIVSAHAYNTSQGRAYIFHSAGVAGITSTVAAATTTLTGEASGNNFFGQSVALGDVNGDGYADAIVSAHANSLFRGRAYIFYSAGAAGITSTGAVSATTKLDGETLPTATSQFGSSVALGDVNGDGYADAIVGARAQNTNIGRAYIFHSAGEAGITSTLAASATTTLTGEAGTGQFGFSVALGDVNGDGYADAIVGAYQYSSNTGRAYIFHAAGAAWIPSTLAVSATTIMTGEALPTATSQFGNSVALGDVNGDGYADALVGALAYSVAGRAYSFKSAGATGITLTTAASATTILTGGGLFGQSVALGDVNGDGYADVMVGAHQFSTSTGRAYSFHSTGAAGIVSTGVASATTILTGEASSQFGYSVR